jgi:hypothetical protein
MFCIGLVFGYLVAGIEASKVAPSTNTAPAVHEAAPSPQAVTETPKTAAPEATYKTVTLENDGMRFAYKDAPSGYDIARTAPLSATDTAFHDGYQLVRTSDAASQQAVNTEGPQSIQVFVMKNPDKLSPRVWAQQNPQYSNVNSIRGDMRDETFGTQSSVTYVADGLYAMEYHIVTAGKYIYVLVGSYDGDTSPILQDFHQFLVTFEFIPVQ